MVHSNITKYIQFTLKCNIWYHYRPQRSCGQGNIFTPVCHSFCSWAGGVCLSACWDTISWRRQPPWTRHPPEQTPPRPDPLGADTPHPEETPPWPDTPRADTPWTRPDTPLPPCSRHPPGSRLQHTVYERPVSILLECILVSRFVPVLIRPCFYHYVQKCFSKWFLSICVIKLLFKMNSMIPELKCL